MLFHIFFILQIIRLLQEKTGFSGLLLTHLIKSGHFGTSDFETIWKIVLQ
jgi:hypothetical protein